MNKKRGLLDALWGINDGDLSEANQTGNTSLNLGHSFGSFDKEWTALLESAKEALNNLTLNDYREGPFIQWALISLDHSLNFAEEGDQDSSLSYLDMCFQALQYAKELLDSPLRTVKRGANDESDLDPVTESLQRSIASLDTAFDHCFQYRIEMRHDRLFQSRAALRGCIQSALKANALLTAN